MERDRRLQIITIIALTICVIGLSIGFAAFSNVLNIKPNATVSPSSNSLNVDFSSKEDEVVISEITPIVSPTNLTASKAVIDNTGAPTISNLNAPFTKPGQSVTYEFYAYNDGELDAFLKSIIYSNVTGESSNKVCTAAVGTTDSLVQSACTGISVKVKVGNESSTIGSVASINNHSLVKKTGEKIIVTIEYAENAQVTDGDFSVSFGDIALNYSSVD